MSKLQDLKVKKYFNNGYYFHEKVFSSYQNYNSYYNDPSGIPARITLDDIPYSEEYKELNNPSSYRVDVNQFHNGQLKLFLTEIQNLTENLDSHTEKALVIYAGSSPSNKALFVSEMFPNVRFIFIDPNHSHIKNTTVNEMGCNCQYEMCDSNSNVVYASKLNNTKFDHCNVKNPRIKTLDGIIKSFNDKVLQLHNAMDLIAEEYERDSDNRFYIFNECLTLELSKKLNSLILKPEFSDSKILFWSDARTNSDISDVLNVPKANSNTESDEWQTVQKINKRKKKKQQNSFNNPKNDDFIGNMAMYYHWVKTIVNGLDDDREFYTMFKFKPFYSFDTQNDNQKILINWNHKIFGDYYRKDPSFLKLIKDGVEKKMFPMFDGTIYIQAFALYKTSETRLCSNLKQIRSELRNYDVVEYENKMFYYNIYERLCRFYKNDYANKDNGIDHCGNCAILSTIVDTYNSKFKNCINIENFNVWFSPNKKYLLNKPHNLLHTFMNLESSEIETKDEESEELDF